MKPFASRYLLLVAFSLLLGACQSTPPAATEAPDARATAIAQLEQSLASSELATAEDQLAALQAESPNDQSLEQYQRQLAEAYLRRSQIVLQKGDVNAAATALSRARALMPKAPALTGGVNNAIVNARKAELDRAEAALMAAEAKPQAKVIDPTAESTTVALNLTDMSQTSSATGCDRRRCGELSVRREHSGATHPGLPLVGHVADQAGEEAGFGV